VSRQFLTPINLVSEATDPGTANTGDIYFNTTTGKIRVYNGTLWNDVYNASPVIYPTSTSSVGVTVKGLASQTGDLQEWQTSSGTVVSKIDSSGIATHPALAITGLTGSNAITSRFVGTTVSGSPTTGAFNAGDMVIDETATIWFCITGGSPGSWTNITANSLTLRSATATAGMGEFTIYSGTTANQTITFPAGALQNGALYQIKNLSTQTVNVKGGTNSISVSGTLYSPSTSYTIPLNAAYTFVYYGTGTGGTWYCYVTTDLAKMANYGTGLTTTGGSLAVDNTVVPELSTTNTFTNTNTFSAGSTTTTPVVVNGAASQTADLQDWKVNGTTVAKVDSAGNFTALSISGGTSSAIQTTMKQVTDTAANWTSNNPTLANGQMGYESDTGKFKIGNGSQSWTALSYATASGGASVTISATAPSSPTAGALWFDSNTGQFFIYYSSYWLEVGAGGSGAASSTITSVDGGSFDSVAPYDGGDPTTSSWANYLVGGTP